MADHLPLSGSILDVRYGEDPYLDALLLHFTTENNIEYFTDPMENASPEQVRFIVALPEEAFYAPCSDWMFLQLLKGQRTPELMREYLSQWKTVVGLIRTHCTDPYMRKRITQLCRHKFRTALAASIFIPSRLLKRMLTVFMSQSGLDDPLQKQRRERNKIARQRADSATFRGILDRCPEKSLSCSRLVDLRFELDFLEVRRLLCLSTVSLEGGSKNFDAACQKAEEECILLEETFKPLRQRLKDRLTVLMLPEKSGGLIYDIRLAKALVAQGHRVIMALKEGFYFQVPTFWDADNDPVLAQELAGARFLSDMRLTKNELLANLAENPFLVISDGTRERFNPYRLSVTFARAWKESDLVLAKGEEHYRRLLMTSHEFTRDVLCYFRGDNGNLHLLFKEKADWVRKFGEAEIKAKAEEIVARMRQARSSGMKNMFYSGIIGSVPGRTKEAITIMNTFVAHLRARLEKVFIINPAEHFEEGMDADDLMYMWEKVQRSGYIDVWRFQTDQDIEKSFESMKKKVPPVWAGKDATYSTGCTKEMQIALDMLARNSEMQIIGPPAEKFFRRREYGVGKFCDVAVDQCEH